MFARIAAENGVVFVERDIWYGNARGDGWRGEIAVRCLLRLEEVRTSTQTTKYTTAFFPFGEDTHSQVEGYHNNVLELWDTNSYRHFYSNDNTGALTEALYELGRDQLVARIFDPEHEGVNDEAFAVGDLVQPNFDPSKKRATTALPLLQRVVATVPGGQKS